MRSSAFTGSEGLQIGIALTVLTSVVIGASFFMVYREVNEAIVVLNIVSKEIKIGM